MELPEQPRSPCIRARNTWSHCGEGAERIWHYSLYLIRLREVAKKGKDCYINYVLVSGLSAGFRVFFNVAWILQVIKDNIESRCDVKLPVTINKVLSIYTFKVWKMQAKSSFSNIFFQQNLLNEIEAVLTYKFLDDLRHGYFCFLGHGLAWIFHSSKCMNRNCRKGFRKEGRQSEYSSRPWAMEESPITVQSCTGFKRAPLQVYIRVCPHGALQN